MRSGLESGEEEMERLRNITNYREQTCKKGVCGEHAGLMTKRKTKLRKRWAETPKMNGTVN